MKRIIILSICMLMSAGMSAQTTVTVDGIGPRESRPHLVNSNWGGTEEDNSFGTHEFLDYCELIGAEPYISGNAGSGSVEEMADWVEYMTAEILRGESASGQSRETLLLEGWRFHQGAANGAESAAYDDSGWQNVTIPHDWAICGPFDKEIDKQVVRIVQNGEAEATEKTGRSGSLPWIGEGWYRTSITIPDGYASAELIFDGAMSEPHVFVDGMDVGQWAYGYNVFKLDITEATGSCSPGTYPLAVHLRNVEESSRWYPGAGLFRPVRLLLHKEKYLKTWGTFARTTMLGGIDDGYCTASEARILVTSDIVASDAGNLSVVQTLKDADGAVVAEVTSSAGAGLSSNSVLVVKDARLWSPEHPVLYTLVTTLKEGEKLWDVSEMKFGIREISYTAEGFRLNGQKRKFKGVCLHHDLGPLGAAFNRAAFRR